MNIVIVSWNILGQYNVGQLIDRMIENGWDVLIVLEPQQATRLESPHPDIVVQRVHVGDQYINVLCSRNISRCNLTAVTIVSGDRLGALVEIVAARGAPYRILTAHAPYRNNDGSAAQFQNAAIAWAGNNNIDLIIGDLNTYGSKVGSSSRSNFRNLSEGLKTSRGGGQLDKALIGDGYYGLPSDVNASTMDLDAIEIPDVSYTQAGSRTSSRPSVQRSGQGRAKKSDHKPMVVMLPAAPLLSTGVSSSAASASAPSSAITAITNDGHCLYRCIAHIRWGDQNRYQEVRNDLADFMRRNWHGHPHLQNLQSLGQLEQMISIVRSTNAWGGEFELAAMAQMYGMAITLVSPQGFAQAVYGPGPTVARIRHTGTHFEVI